MSNSYIKLINSQELLNINREPRYFKLNNGMVVKEIAMVDTIINKDGYINTYISVYAPEDTDEIYNVGKLVRLINIWDNNKGLPVGGAYGTTHDVIELLKNYSSNVSLKREYKMTSALKCKQCGSVQRVIIPFKHIPICRSCNKMMV